ncbi:MAG TPA: hypothetical protein VMV69_16240 [Pirellulales bacterium]|nr:hypothetical protein [Pirellulales bacterium]
MSAVKGTVQNGHIVLDRPTDLPEGCRVIVEPMMEVTFGIREEDWSDAAEAIVAWLQWYDSLEPLQRTPQEEVEWQVARELQTEREKVGFGERAEKLRRMWE